MSRAIVNLTESWQEISTVEAVYTVQQLKRGEEILINTAQSETAAMRLNSAKLGKQVQQTASVSTYAKATSATGCVLIVDTDA